MIGRFGTYLALAGCLLMLPACTREMSEFAGSSLPQNPVSIDVYHVDWLPAKDDPDDEMDFQNWLMKNRITADDDLVILRSRNSEIDLSFFTKIWADHSSRPIKVYEDVPSGDGILTLRLYRRHVRAASCYDGAGRYILGCAVRHNRLFSLHQLNPPQITETTRPAIYETVPDQKALAFEKPGWINAGDGK